jgi:hypothetical protein
VEHSQQELELLQALKELQGILAEALNTLEGKVASSPQAEYASFVAQAVNSAADGYLVLRHTYRMDASKLLVRPAIELILGGMAVENAPELLARKAFSEWKDHGKLFKDHASQAQHKKNWDEFEKKFRSECPQYPIQRKRLTILNAAKCAKMESIYELAYRIYCKFTHGALEAINGNFDRATDPCDSHIMLWCVGKAIDLLGRKTPATLPDMKPIYGRMEHLISDPLSS